MGIALLIILVLMLLGPWLLRILAKLMHKWAARRYEDAVRRMMGMPTREEEKKRKKKKDSGRGFGFSRKKTAHRASSLQHPSELLKSVAEDVEFVEIKDFSSRTILEDTNNGVKVIQEEQVSDVEYKEIKITHKAS